MNKRIKRLVMMTGACKVLADYIDSLLEHGTIYDYCVNMDFETGHVDIATKKNANSKFLYTAINLGE